MNRKTIFVAAILMFALGFGFLKAQTTLTGTVLGKSTNAPLSGAVVQEKGSENGAYTDENGRFELVVNKDRIVLRIAYLGFRELNQIVDIRVQAGRDGKVPPLTFSLSPDDVTLATTTITDGRLARVHPDKSVQVQDFEFLGEDVMLIVYDPDLKRNVLELRNDYGQQLAQYPHAAESPMRLETDCFGNLQCLSKNYAWQIDYVFRQLILRGDSIHYYKTMLQPCLALLDSTYFFAFQPHKFLKSFIYVKAEDRRKRHLYASMDTAAVTLIDDEAAMSLLYTPGAGGVRGGSASSFQEGLNARYLEEIQFPEVYIPMHVLGGEACIFDHTRKKLLKFNADGKQTDEIPITYPELRRWKPNVIVDQEHRRAFTLTEKNGLTTVHRIDLDSGELGESWELPLPFVQKIRVRGDYVYFMYRDKVYDPVKRLYRFEM